eukprot:3356631-Amphidinium_carterae.1
MKLDRPCAFFDRGQCLRGAACPFAHGQEVGPSMEEWSLCPRFWVPPKQAPYLRFQYVDAAQKEALLKRSKDYKFFRFALRCRIKASGAVRLESSCSLVS